jgi:hypothetical protein
MEMGNRMKTKSTRKLIAAAALTAAATVCSAASANTIETTANSWLVQDYPSGQGIVLWYTGSSCTNGQLLFNVGEPVERHNRLLAMVLAVKAMNARVHLDYNIVGSSCITQDFGVIGP